MSTTETSLAPRPLERGAPRAPVGDTGAVAVLGSLGLTRDAQWAWENYKPTVVALSRNLGLAHLLEIGGGRNPLFTPQEAAGHGFALTVNDISDRELELAPASFGKACFDISRLPAGQEFDGRFDLVFSRMVFEHVRDVRSAWANVHRLLTPGGVALAFVPTLYCPPYVANLMMPEAISSAIVRRVYRNRSEDGLHPKFPAHYDHCYSIESKVRPMLEESGFSEIDIVPFWGHDYFQRMPGLRELDDLLSRVAKRNGWRALTSYAYVIVRK